MIRNTCRAKYQMPKRDKCCNINTFLLLDISITSYIWEASFALLEMTFSDLEVQVNVSLV